MVDISSIDGIKRNIGFQNDGFSFVHTAGDLVNNREFSNGYSRFRDGYETDRSTYVWNVLSAIGDEIGDTLYTNVRNYISRVCDVDTCSIKQLQSLVKMTGAEYSIIKSDDQYPQELMDLIDVFSIGKKFILNGDMIRSSYLSSLYDRYDFGDGNYRSVISGGISSVSEFLRGNADAEVSAQLSGFQYSHSVDSRTMDASGQESAQDSNYSKFVRVVVKNLILDFLTLKHGGEEYVFKQICREDSQDTTKFTDDEYRNDKIRLGIPISFDQDQIVDNINDGYDSLDNYQGNKLTFLKTVIQDRSKKYNNIPNSQYAYYRKRKVRQYNDFVLNKYYNILMTEGMNVQNYRVNTQYYQMQNNDTFRLFDMKDYGDRVDKFSADKLIRLGIIDGTILDKVIDSIVDTINYICEIRNKIKLQVRKNYMRGTNNLLLYVINEFLLDYYKYTELSDIKEYFRENPPKIDDLQVVEYYDSTEYFNINTDADQYSLSSGRSTNDRYWDGKLASEPSKYNNYSSTTLNEIQQFYLSVLNLKDIASQVSTEMTNEQLLSDFLYTIYDCGANKDSQTKDGFINTKVYRDGMWTTEMYNRFNRLSSNYWSFSVYLSSGEYEFQTSTQVSTQISDVTNNFIYVNLSNYYLSGVSAVFDEFKTSVDYLSDFIDEENQEYDDLLSGDMSFYFEKADIDVYPYCYDSEGNYKHNWYDPSGYEYVYDKWQSLYQYCQTQDNVRNYPLIDTMEYLSAQLKTLSSDLYVNVINDIVDKYGYVYLQEEYLQDEIDSIKEFLDQKIRERRTYLQELLDSLTQQAQSIRSDYIALKAQVPGAIAQYKNQFGLSNIYTLDFAVGQRKCGSALDTCSNQDQTLQSTNSPKYKYTVDGVTYEGTATYDPITKRYYYIKYTSEGVTGNFHYVGTFTQDKAFNGTIIENESDIDSVLTSLQYMMNMITTVNYQAEYDDDGKVCGCIERDHECKYMDVGVNSAINVILDSFNTLQNSAGSLQNTVSELLGVEIEGESLEILIDNIIEALNNNGYDIFKNDSVLKSLNDYLTKTRQYEKSFKSEQSVYVDIAITDYKNSVYLGECEKDSRLTFTNITAIQKYISTKDVENRDTLLAEILGHLDEYAEKLQFYGEAVNNLSQRRTIPDSYVRGGTILEVEIASLLQFLIDDVANKTEEANRNIDAEKEKIQSYLSVIEEEISDYLAKAMGFPEAVEDRLDYLNFYNKDKYLERKEMFLQYGGRDFCYYPYMNVKNIEHPSYQIHPYLWNFIEKDKYTSKLCKEFYNIQIDDFERGKIENAISCYIGQYGNVIDAWKNGTVDHSGYTTTYESSTHVTTAQVKSDVIDFEGTFFPPAINDLFGAKDTCIKSMTFAQEGRHSKKDQLKSGILSRLLELEQITLENVRTVTNEQLSGITTTKSSFDENIGDYIQTHAAIDCEDLANVVIDNVNETFYGKYYDHLALTKHDIGIEKDRILYYYNEISAITQGTDVSGVYDIYKYGKDINQNVIILFKKYGVQDPTFKQKRDTLGDIWVRIKDNPFAFPAFYGQYPQIKMDDKQYCNPAIYRLSKTFPSGDNLEPLSSCRFFYDFDTTNDGYTVSFVAYPTNKGRYTSDGTIEQQFNQDEKILRDYENPQILIGYSQNITDNGGNKFVTLYFDKDNSNLTEYIKSGAGRDTYTALSSDEPEYGSAGIDNYAYIGSYQRDLQNMFYVYALKNYKKNQVSLGNEIRIQSLRDGVMQGNKYQSQSFEIVTGQDTSRGEICFSFDDQTNILTFAYLTESSGRKHTTDGNPFEYQCACEMNSNDEMTNGIRIVKATNSGQQLKPIEKSDIDIINIQADVSYKPAFPSLSSATDITQDNKYSGFTNVQLLGVSKDITERIECVNENANPYISYSDLSSNGIYGRVFEDYDNNSDTTLTAYQNPIIRGVENTDEISWNIDIDGYVKGKDLKNMMVLAYNQSSLGRSKYILTSLTSLMKYETYGSYDIERRNEIHISGTTKCITVNGLAVDDYSNIASNRINGVSSVSFYVSNNGSYTFTTKLHVDASKLPSKYVHVGEGKINVMLFDPYDIKTFEYYHMFDTYGLVYAMSANSGIIRSALDGDGWKIITNPKNDTDGIQFYQELLERYYDDAYGNRMRKDDIHLSDYNALSDVWLFDTSRRLQFKYSEEDAFSFGNDSYYYPGLNCRYPITKGQNLAGNKIILAESDSSMIDYFNGDNLYIFDILCSDEVMDGICSVEIDTYNVGDRDELVREEYLSTSTEGGTTFDNADKYDIYDDESMREYYIVSEDSSDDVFTVIVADRCDDIGEQPKVCVDIDGSSADVSDITKLFVNYRKTDHQTIELFFNYFNYIQTPFIEIRDDGRQYMKTVENSYLRIDSGENGTLDIYVQFKYFNGTRFVGMKMVRVASYRVYNVSDDKPKFMLKKIFSVGQG